MIKVCQYCGEEFHTYPSRNQKYCSRDCYFEHRFGPNRVIWKMCPVCGKRFKSCASQDRKYCSDLCFRHWNLREVPTPAVPNDFGHWLAGFIDGEGSFTITVYRNKDGSPRHYGTRFHIGLRDDDSPIIEEIADRLGFGLRVQQRGSWDDRYGKRHNPQKFFQLNSAIDCMKLVKLLDKYPLRAKKAKSYAIWRLAVIEKMKGPKQDKAYLLQLRDELMAANRYNGQ